MTKKHRPERDKLEQALRKLVPDDINDVFDDLGFETIGFVELPPVCSCPLCSIGRHARKFYQKSLP